MDNMKIAITTTGVAMNSPVDHRFGRCRYFGIYDVESKEYCVIENAARLTSGGAGIQSAQIAVESGANTILTGNLGPNAWRALEAAKMIDSHKEKEATITASMAFAYGTEMELEVTNSAVMTLAGEAITNRTDRPSVMWRMAPVMWVVGGTTDIQKFIIQRELYGPLMKKDKKVAPKPKAS